MNGEMSLMSPKIAAILSPQQRRDIIKDNILEKEYDELAVICHCTERTIKRDVHKWKAEGGFQEFLLDEFFRSYPNIKEKFPEKAFDRLCYLLGKTLTHKVEKEIKTERKVEERYISLVGTLKDYEDAIERANRHNLRAKHSQE